MLEPWRQAGVGFLSITAGFDARPWTRIVENIAAVRRRLAEEAPWCRLVGTVAELDAARAEGLTAAAFDIEGFGALNGRLDMVQLYHHLGVRQMLIAYNRNNAGGSGCHDEDIGLTAFGRAVIDEMNRVGMVVDCTHSGHRATIEAMERSTAPVVFSHSNPRALADHGRNITDEQIRACAATGGVIGINGVNLFLGDGARATVESVARHAAHVAGLVGAAHVGLSLDYMDLDALNASISAEPGVWPPGAGYDRPLDILAPRRLPEVTAALLAIGFSAEEVRGVLGGNFRRVAEAVWRQG